MVLFFAGFTCGNSAGLTSLAFNNSRMGASHALCGVFIEVEIGLAFFANSFIIAFGAIARALLAIVIRILIRGLRATIEA